MTISERMKDIYAEQILLAIIQDQILGEPFSEETATSRLKQIEVTGLTRGGVIETIDPLVKRGLLIQTIGRNAMGRGTARQFEIAPAVRSAAATTLGAGF